MTSHTQRQLFTVSNYHKTMQAGILTPEDIVELIDGEILKRSPIKSEHAGIHSKTLPFPAKPWLLNRLAWRYPSPDYLVNAPAAWRGSPARPHPETA